MFAYGSAVAAVALVTAIGLVLFPYAELPDITMLYLVAIMLASLSGRGPSVVAASLSVAAYDFCFVPPRFTLVVAEASHLFTFAVMFGAGLAISTLTGRLRRQERDAAIRERNTIRYAEQAREAALRARTEELRSSLLSTVSHDLRTPLAVITGAATTLRDDADRLTPAARDELLSSIVDDARRLERILGNLLQLTRVESGLVANREWVPVEELVGAALTRLEDTLGDRTVVLDVPAELVMPVDPVLFEQVLINLVDNAVKHGAPPIEISARREGGTIELAVRDHGPGIPVDAAPRLFDKFVRASTAPGAGLGLAVVRAIVEAHGGTVAAADAPGGGARFVVRMPARQHTGPPDPLATLPVREAAP
ncbi:MAG TPA: ATP-binding protein [Kofleriaceae bacterium]|nr:ATP-binding protein [Kofleriaceae bacterium]